MNDTPEPTDHDRRGRPIKRRCTGHRKDGRRCRRSAIHGGTVCTSHGGAASQVQAAAARRVADERVAAVLERWTPPANGTPVDVFGELGNLAARLVSFCDFATARLAALDGDDWAERSERTEAEVRQFQVASAQAGRVLDSVARLGLDYLDRQMVERRHGEYVAAVINRVLARFGVHASDDQVPGRDPCGARADQRARMTASVGPQLLRQRQNARSAAVRTPASEASGHSRGTMARKCSQSRRITSRTKST